MPYQLKPSGIYLVLLVVAHLSAALSVCLTNLHPWARVGLIFPVVLSLLYHLNVHLRAQRGWRSFTLEKGHVSVITRGGDALYGELAPRTLVTPLCVVLCAKNASKQVCQVIFCDAMDCDAFRELRVRLRFC